LKGGGVLKMPLPVGHRRVAQNRQGALVTEHRLTSVPTAASANILVCMPRFRVVKLSRAPAIREAPVWQGVEPLCVASLLPKVRARLKKEIVANGYHRC
jgi:hypothetical protein